MNDTSDRVIQYFRPNEYWQKYGKYLLFAQGYVACKNWLYSLPFMFWCIGLAYVQ